MRTRRFLIAANWKMHAPPKGFDAPGSPYRSTAAADVVALPSALDIRLCADAGLVTGAQCGRAETDGAFTGDLSMAMLKSAGATWVICGHSERRRHHEESDATIRAQAEAALAAGLTPIVCAGETGDEREQGMQNDIVRRQLAGMPPGITVAYEPVWAIGTGNTPTPEEAEAMHAFIRTLPGIGEGTRILYGGSVTAKNAVALLACPDIDGALVGGASLKPTEFAAIVAAAGA